MKIMITPIAEASRFKMQIERMKRQICFLRISRGLARHPFFFAVFADPFLKYATKYAAPTTIQ